MMEKELREAWEMARKSGCLASSIGRDVEGHAGATFWAELDLEEHWELLLRPGHGTGAWELHRFKSGLVLSNGSDGMSSDSPDSVLKTLDRTIW